MSSWRATKAKRALAALERLGWKEKRPSGSHRTLSRPGWPDVVFAFHDNEGFFAIAIFPAQKKFGATEYLK